MRWAADRTLQQPGDALLEDGIDWQPDRVFVTLGFQEFVKLRVGKCGIAAEIAALHLVSVTRNDRLQNIAPAIRGVHVLGPQRTPLQITELAEHEQRMIAHAGEMAVVGGALLRTMGFTHTAVHVEHDRRLRPARMHSVDPCPGQPRQRIQVGLAGQPPGLKPAHLAGRGGGPVETTPIDDGTHRRVMCQTVGIVHILIAGETAKHRLAKQPSQHVARVLATAALRQLQTRPPWHTSSAPSCGTGSPPWGGRGRKGGETPLPRVGNGVSLSIFSLHPPSPFADRACRCGRSSC
jgi:hypothetical protein